MEVHHAGGGVAQLVRKDAKPWLVVRRCVLGKDT